MSRIYKAAVTIEGDQYGIIINTIEIMCGKYDALCRILDVIR
jgi:hypothetical protein